MQKPKQFSIIFHTYLESDFDDFMMSLWCFWVWFCLRWAWNTPRRVD